VILSPCRSDSLAEKEAAILNVNVTVQIIKKIIASLHEVRYKNDRHE